MRIVLLPFLFASLAVALPARAAESYDSCAGTITTLPATITTQGVWCLKSDLATAISSGDAILINANNVTLDCNGFKIGGLAAGAGTLTHGIRLADNRQNAAIRNCSIRGFFIGAIFDSGSGHNIERNRFDGNLYTSIVATQPGSRVVGNLVLDTGGTINLSSAIGIMSGSGVDILDNTVDGVMPADLGVDGNANGIYLNGNDGSVLADNRVRSVVPRYGGTANGIRLAVSGNGIVRGNSLQGSPGSHYGINCASAVSTAYQNVIVGFLTPVLNCTSVGNVVD